MHPLKAVLFDFDGVIANILPILRFTFFEYFSKNKLKISEKAYEENGWASKSLAQICDILAKDYNIHLEANTLRKDIWQTQADLMEKNLEFDPTLLPFLTFCREQGIRIAIGSNSVRERIVWVLEKMGILEYFIMPPCERGEEKRKKYGGLQTQNSQLETRNYSILGANDITHHKPDPEVWIKCSEMLGIPLDECLVIEDGFPGLSGAKACGARGIYYHRFCRPDKHCREIAEKSVGSFGNLFE